MEQQQEFTRTAGDAVAEMSRVTPLRSTMMDTLTTREMQVLRLMADGLSTKEIGSKLGVTFKTAASHRSRILSKLDVHETVSAVRWAIRHGIIEP